MRFTSFRVRSFRVEGLGFRVRVLFRVQGFGRFRRFRVRRFGVEGLGFVRGLFGSRLLRRFRGSGVRRSGKSSPVPCGAGVPRTASLRRGVAAVSWTHGAAPLPDAFGHPGEDSFHRPPEGGVGKEEARKGSL